MLVCSSEWWLSLISHSLSCEQQNLKGPEDVSLTRLCICMRLPKRQGWAVCFPLWFIALEPFLFNSHEFGFTIQSIFNHAALIKQNKIQLCCKANSRVDLNVNIAIGRSWTYLEFLLPPDVKRGRWQLCAAGTICTHTRWAHPSFLHLSHRWLKPSGKPDLLAQFSDPSESCTINITFCFPAPQVFSPQSLFAFQTYLQIFQGRQIRVCWFRSSVLDSFLKTDNSLKTRTWFHDSRSVSSFSLLWCWQFLSIITPHQAWRALQDHQHATDMCPAFSDLVTASSCRATEYKHGIVVKH